MAERRFFSLWKMTSEVFETLEVWEFGFLKTQLRRDKKGGKPMGKHILIVHIVIALTLAIGISSLADVPQHISFQGKLHDDAGNPLTGQYEVTFRIYTTQSGGTALWTETLTVDCENGLYSVILGKTSPITLDFDGQYWLGVQVTGNNELSPRYELTAVPGAFRAAVADSAIRASKLDGKDAADFAASDHQHDGRYYTETELKTNDGTVNESGDPVSWFKIKDMPAGFADGTDEVGSTGDGISQVAAGWGITVTDPTGPTATVALQSEVTGSQTTPIFSAANTGDGYGLQGQSAGNMGVGVLGAATATGYSANYGGYFSAASDLGRAVAGEATSTSMYENFGGRFTAAGESGWGIYGEASGNYGRGVGGQASATGDYANYGGWFEAAGNSGAGVSGQATATGNVENYGGIFDAWGNDGRGVFGRTPGDRGQGVRGEATATGFVLNHGGYFEAAGDIGRGVYGKASATGNVLNAGGWFETLGDQGVGVAGIASASGSVENRGGSFLAYGNSGRGVYGNAAATGFVLNYGGYFEADGDIGRGVYGEATATGDVANTGGWFESMGDLGIGVTGIATATGDFENRGGFFLAYGNTGTGVYGEATATSEYENFGGWFSAAGSNGKGVYGRATGVSGQGVQGEATATGYYTNYGGWFSASGNYGTGVYGQATAFSDEITYGGEFYSYGYDGRGVYGEASAMGENVLNFGGYFKANGDDGRGVYGEASATGSGENYGGFFKAEGQYGRGVYGEAMATVGDAVNYGGYFRSNSQYGTGVYGLVTAESENAYAVRGKAYGNGYAGYFEGRVHSTGAFTHPSSSYLIDHPLDPENKYLHHASVESPDMKNVYDGIVTLDAMGEAVVELPEYFEVLNRDFRYQLTAIGAPGPNLFIEDEIWNNHFKIAGGQPGMKVSWQVTGIRQDAYANAHRIPVEEEKSIDDRGKYLHPTEHGVPETMGIMYTKD